MMSRAASTTHRSTGSMGYFFDKAYMVFFWVSVGRMDELSADTPVSVMRREDLCRTVGEGLAKVAVKQNLSRELLPAPGVRKLARHPGKLDAHVGFVTGRVLDDTQKAHVALSVAVVAKHGQSNKGSERIRSGQSGNPLSARKKVLPIQRARQRQEHVVGLLGARCSGRLVRAAVHVPAPAALLS